MIVLRSKAQLDSFRERNPYRTVYTPGYSYQGCPCCGGDYMDYDMKAGEYGVSIALRPIRRGVFRVVEVYEEEYYSYDEYGDIEDRHFRVVQTKTVAIYRPRK
tara:strand:+ start:238 stop:546 length:309 start_codon:yes stop_codon:yes gene_type:complete